MSSTERPGRRLAGLLALAALLSLPATALALQTDRQKPIAGNADTPAGILGDGVAASTRIDGQAKSLGEYLRAKHIDAPDELIADIRTGQAA